ncbi:MAG TPA: hypothetical protein VMT86_16170 [Bryobacteraceae bacterium]|nr:hypothetical protein [Bryobacteraceae bacterium]
MKRRALLAGLSLLAAVPCLGQMLGSHKAVYDEHGILQPWTSWDDAIGREMSWYLHCPVEHGYPRFVFLTFMDGKYQAVTRRKDTIPAMQNGMGILSYLKYYAYKGRRNPDVLRFARAMGDYLVTESLTPDTGVYPRFTRSTGIRATFPLPPGAGSQKDGPYEIEPDKGGIAGYALVELYRETKDKHYLDQALQNARLLAANMRDGSANSSPWPFRADYRTGEPHGLISANMSYNLRLFDALAALGYSEFAAPRARLWKWIKELQIPDASKNAILWVQFHEDYDMEGNRNAWSALNLARLLVERRDALDPDWRADSRDLLLFVIRRFTSIRFGVPVSGEQDDDKDPWGGALTNYGGTLAVYSAATGSDEFKGLAWQALTLALYAIDDNGCPRDSLLRPACGGWQEDAHTDVIHNYVDAMEAFPEWAK